MSEYQVILEEFFDLKTNYEEKYRKKKASIINKKDLSKKQKRKMVENIKIGCVGCKKPVGTIFYDKDRVYGAICGSSDNPCGLNIEIKKSKNLNISNMLDIFQNEINTNEFNIKLMKLYLLFDLISEESLIEFYETEKEEYKSNSEFKENMEETLEMQTNMEYRKAQIQSLNQELYQQVKELKENMNDYMVNENNKSLENAIEIYDDEINDIVKRIRENKYSMTVFETEQEKLDELPKIYIRNKVNTIEDHEIVVEDGQVIHFEK